MQWSPTLLWNDNCSTAKTSRSGVCQTPLIGSTPPMYVCGSLSPQWWCVALARPIVDNQHEARPRRALCSCPWRSRVCLLAAVTLEVVPQTQSLLWIAWLELLANHDSECIWVVADTLYSLLLGSDGPYFRLIQLLYGAWGWLKLRMSTTSQGCGNPPLSAWHVGHALYMQTWHCLLADDEQPHHVCYSLSASWFWGSHNWTMRLNLLTGELWTISPQPLVATCLGSQIQYIIEWCRPFSLGVHRWTRHYSFDPLAVGTPLQVATFPCCPGMACVSVCSVMPSWWPQCQQCTCPDLPRMRSAAEPS